MGTFVLGASRAEPGPFVASIAPGAVLLLDDRQGGVESALTSAVMATAASGDRAAVLAAMRAAVDTHPAGAAILVDSERNSAFLFGPISIVAETAGAQIDVRATGGSVDEVPLPSALTSISIGPAETAALAPGEGEIPLATAFRAARVRIDLVPMTAPPGLPGASAQDVAAPSSGLANPDPSVESAPQAEIGPQVLGVRCPRDHHNHPDAVYCAQCGLRMGVNHTLVARLGPRPPLGVVVLDDGSTLSIESDLVVGREPQFHALVVSGMAQSATVVDPELNLSRAHFALRLDGWNILASDLGSSNGTYLQREGRAEWEPLAADHGIEVGSGDRLRAGSRVFHVQLHHVQG